MKAHQWTKKQAETAKNPNYSKLYVVGPALYKSLGSVKNKNILEIGCGNGYWLRLLTKKGAKCTGIDKARNQLALAKKEPFSDKINYIFGDITKKTNLKGSYYDIIFLEHVLLEIPTIKEIYKLFKEAYRVTKKDGFLVVSDTHPMAPHLNMPNIKVGKDYSYFKRGYIHEVTSKKPDGGIVSYADYHYPLEAFVDAITNAGFKIVGIMEPRPSDKIVKKIPYLAYRKDKPSHIVVKAQKI